MRVIVCIDGLRLQTSDSIELLNSGRTQASQCAEHRTLDLGHLCVLNCIDQGVLGLRGVVLQFLRGVLFPKWSNLIEVHLQVMCHLLRELILRCMDPCICNGNGSKHKNTEGGDSNHCA